LRDWNQRYKYNIHI